MESNRQRLQKILADRGVCSRRAAEQLILDGRVSVNGKVVETLGTKADPTSDRIAVDGKLLLSRPKLRYILLYKPAGYITSAKDERGRRTVLDLIKEIPERVYPVGRLDYNTSGVILLTNDGALTHDLLHPSHEITKTYRALVEGTVTASQIQQLRNGIKLTDGMTAPAQCRIIKNLADQTDLEITIHEGRNRQVRRMCEAIGHAVVHLSRTHFAFLDLSGLRPSQWRELSSQEVKEIKKLCNREEAKT